MAVPSTSIIWAETLDPSDVLDFSVDCTALLDAGDTISSYTVLIPTEGQLYGLGVKTTSPYVTTLVGNTITFWLWVDDADSTNSVFSGVGVVAPVQITITTASNPPRKKQRTLGITVVQK